MWCPCSPLSCTLLKGTVDSCVPGRVLSPSSKELTGFPGQPLPSTQFPWKRLRATRVPLLAIIYSGLSLHYDYVCISVWHLRWWWGRRSHISGAWFLLAELPLCYNCFPPCSCHTGAHLHSGLLRLQQASHTLSLERGRLCGQILPPEACHFLGRFAAR